MSERLPRLLPAIASTALLVVATVAPAGCNPGAEEGEDADSEDTGEDEVRVEVQVGGS